MKAISAALLLIVGIPAPALGWGAAGHRIAAEIAEQRLEPETTRQVRQLLAIEHATTLAQVSTWADDIRPQRRETTPWHFVNVPIHPPPGTPAAYEPARDCPRGDCVVAVIERFDAVLRDKAAAPRDRLEALKFVVHLVADLHQPLHCADEGDRGNDTHVIFLGQHTSLEAVWDSSILEAAQIGDARAYALQLAKAITPAELAQWRGGSPAEWANESYRLGRMIYGASHEARALQLFYETDFLPVVNVQLEKAGTRLAAVLNEIFR